MKLIDTEGSENGRFVAGDPTTGKRPTRLDPSWCNAIQDEIANVILKQNMALDAGNPFQLYQAILDLVMRQKQMTEPSFYGSVLFSGDYKWDLTHVNEVFIPEALGDYPDPIVSGQAILTGKKTPGLLLKAMPPGRYLFLVEGWINVDKVNPGEYCEVYLHPTLTEVRPGAIGAFITPPGAKGYFKVSVTGSAQYKNSQDREFKLEMKPNGSSISCVLDGPLEISVYRFPN